MRRSEYVSPIDTRDPAFIEDPYPFYEALHAAGPVHRDSLGIWWLTGYADIKALLQDRHRISRDPRRWALYAQLRPNIADSVLERTVEQWMLTLDPPAHTRLRKLVQNSFTAGATARLRAPIEAVARELVAGLRGQRRFELMAGLAQPLPVRVICDLMGLPPEDFGTTKAWSDLLVWVLEPSAPWAMRREADRACTEMLAYLRAQVARARQARRDDLLSQLIAAQEDQDRLSEDELLATLVLLFLAGHETTTNLIGNGLLALLRHPEQLARLRADPSLIDTAVDELLRFDGPVTLLPRVAAAPIEIGGHTVQPGELLHLVLGSAHRDGTVFAEPGRMDIGRQPNPQVALQALLEAFPRLSVAAAGAEPALQWRTLTTLRGLQRLELDAGDGSA